MTGTEFVDPERLGRLVADSIVIGADQGAVDANPFYLHRVRPLVDAVEHVLRSHPSPAFAAAVTDLQRHPARRSAYRALVDLVTAADSDAFGAALRAAARKVLAGTRISYRVGDDYDTHWDVGVSDLIDDGVGPIASAGPDAEILIVIPFRDDSAGGTRMRNLLACLRTLRDQSLDHARFRVCVVESDERPRWRAPISALADDYVFAPKSGAFNKSWAVNVGVRESAASATLVCVLDADALVDREFVARNAARFERAGTGGFLPFRDLTYLDADSSDYAIEARCLDGAGRPDPARLRAFVVHRSPGVCVWVRREVFEAINGMDERFEDWGGEDMAFVMRLTLATAFLHFDDPMYHLYHRASSRLVDGHTVNAHIPWQDWSPEHPIGDIDRFRPVAVAI
jgi:hypothetical protein